MPSSLTATETIKSVIVNFFVLRVVEISTAFGTLYLGSASKTQVCGLSCQESCRDSFCGSVMGLESTLPALYSYL